MLTLLQKACQDRSLTFSPKCAYVSGMTRQQIKILHSYGWSTKEIATFLDLPESGVRMFMEEEGILSEDATNVTIDITENTPTVVTAESRKQQQQDSVAENLMTLKAREVDKQLNIAPIAAAIELELLGKLYRAARDCDENNVALIASLIKSFKTLTQDSVSNMIVKTDKDAKDGGSQIVVPVMVFRDS